MAFKKNSVIPIEKIRCGCGAVLPQGAHICSSCKRVVGNIPPSAEKEDVDVKKEEKGDLAKS